MAKNKNLTQAKKAKNDEFYTLISDVEKELKHYKKYFEGKVVYCNCDDPEESNFWKFFELNFEEYKLKKLISTHYDAEKPTYKLELSADIDGDGKITKGDIVKTPLKQNGDFRSEESINLLKESDIICTNPPFSLFHPYIEQLLSSGKKFLILGNNNCCNYLADYFKSGKVRLGYSSNKTMEFCVPENYIAQREQNGIKYSKVPAISWYTNLPVEQIEKLILTKKYNSKDFPNCDNYNAIYVDKVANIPIDYQGVIAVPITILKYMNKENKINANINGETKYFKILGATYSTDKSDDVEKIRTDPEKRHTPFVNGKEKYPRYLIQLN